jgi:hypothetical protein
MNATSRFTHINESFVCDYCGMDVPPAGLGCRNHCPFCLSSKHVDHFPGDRASTCHGRLVAESYEVNAKKGIVLIFRCLKCNIRSRNKALCRGLAPDDYDKILKLKPNL